MFLVADFKDDSIESGTHIIAKRKWETTTFDLATLYTKHKLHLSYQAMDFLLHYCNLELAILEKESLEEAIESFKSFQIALYTIGISPFLSPFITTYSINEYSGINSRDSDSICEKLPEALKSGLRTNTGTLEAWPFELSFQCITLNDKRILTETHFKRASVLADKWSNLKKSSKSLITVGNTVSNAPKLVSISQSILHIWSGIESLFPNINIELSFKLSLFLAQLNAENEGRLTYYKQVKKAYSLRSKIAHGATDSVKMDDWEFAWKILMDSINAVVRRNRLPSEEELTEELLIKGIY